MLVLNYLFMLSSNVYLFFICNYFALFKLWSTLPHRLAYHVTINIEMFMCLLRSYLSRQFQSKCVFASNYTHVLKHQCLVGIPVSDLHATDLCCFKYKYRMGVGTYGFIGRFL